MSSTSLESFTVGNPNPSSIQCSKKSASMSLCRPESMRFESLHQPHATTYRVSLTSRTVSPRLRGLASLPLHRLKLRNRSIFPLAAASHEESKPSEIEEPEEKSNINVQAKESEEAWNQTLAYFKEQALKMQSVSQEAYEQYSKKAMVVLKEASEQLKIQAEKARQDLSVIAKEVSEEGKEYLSTATENSPEPVKDIVETFASSTDNLNEISEVRDFYLGIPYGVLLSFGGFLSFMITGSISAIRFGIILGGSLLALSISSLRSWKRGESSSIALKGQAAIASILLLKDLRILFVTSSFASFLTALISGSMVAFYIYRISLDDKHTKGSNLEPGKEI